MHGEKNMTVEINDPFNKEVRQYVFKLQDTLNIYMGCTHLLNKKRLTKWFRLMTF